MWRKRRWEKVRLRLPRSTEWETVAGLGVLVDLTLRLTFEPDSLKLHLPLLKGFHGHSYSLHPTLSVQEQTIWISAVIMRNHMIEPLGGHPNIGDEHPKASQSELQSWGSNQNNGKKEQQRSVEQRFQHTERLGGGARKQESSAFHFYVFQRQHGLMGKTKRPCFCITDGTAGGLGMTQTLKEEPLSRIRLKCIQAWVPARNTTCDFNISHHQERGYLLDFPFLKLYIPAD